MAPKKAKLAEAQESLAATKAVLDQKRAELKEVEDRLTALQKTFEEKTEEKARLEMQVESCARKLERAEKLIGGLSGEKIRSQPNYNNLLLAVFVVAVLVKTITCLNLNTPIDGLKQQTTCRTLTTT